MCPTHRTWADVTRVDRDETELEGAETGDDDALPKTELESGPPKRIRYDQSWLSSFLRPILIAVLVACINIAFGAFMVRFVPDSPPGLFGLIVLLGVVAALIATASTAWLAQPDQRLNRTVAYRTAEFALIVMLVRLGLWLIRGYCDLYHGHRCGRRCQWYDDFSDYRYCSSRYHVPYEPAAQKAAVIRSGRSERVTCLDEPAKEETC